MSSRRALGGARSPLAISGMGLTSAAGAGVEALAAALREERSCLGRLEHIRTDDLPVPFGGEVPPELFDAAQARGQNRALCCAESALVEALESAERTGAALQRERIGLALGTVLGPIEEWERAQHRHGRVGEALVQRNSIGSLASALAAARGARPALGGPRTVFSLACTSGICAAEQAAADLALDRAEAMLVGAVDTLGRVMQSGFCVIGSLPAHPLEGSFDPSREGFVLGEAAGFVVLEPLEALRARGARPRALLVSQRLVADGFSLSTPEPDGKAMAQAISGALADAGLETEEVGAITITAMGSPPSVRMLQNALDKALGPWVGHIPLTSFESAIGHVLSATSVVVLTHAAWLIEHGQVRPIVKLQPGKGGVVVPGAIAPLDPPVVLALSVGFGGQNGATVLVEPAFFEKRTAQGRPSE